MSEFLINIMTRGSETIHHDQPGPHIVGRIGCRTVKQARELERMFLEHSMAFNAQACVRVYHGRGTHIIPLDVIEQVADEMDRTDHTLRSSVKAV